MTRVRLAIGACALLACAVAGCGSGTQSGEDVPGGKVTGTGYALQLPDGWRAAGTRSALRREAAKDLGNNAKGFDPGGILLDGRWQDFGDDRKPTINVVIEPVTSDTNPTVYARGSAKTLPGAHEVSGPRALGGEPASTFAYRAPRDRDARLVTAQHGDYGFSVTFQANGGDTKELDRTVRAVVASWRFQPITGAGRARLAHTHEAAADTWAIELPDGWRATGAKVLRRLGSSSPVGNASSVWRGHLSATFGTNVVVSQADPPSEDLDAVTKAVATKERSDGDGSRGYSVTSVRRDNASPLDGEAARALDVRSSTGTDELHQRELLTLHDGKLYRVVLSAQQERFERDLKSFDAAMSRWRWR